jgi:hypothetical protein
MPALRDPRHEAFAQARAKGARLDDAYEAAGYVLAKGHSSRMAARPEVAERIAELRALQADEEAVSLPAVIAALMRIAKAGAASENPAKLKEARLALVDAARLEADLARGRHGDHYSIMQENQHSQPEFRP